MAGIFADVPAFVQGLTFADLPAEVVEQARRCLLDLIGVAAAGSRTSAAHPEFFYVWGHSALDALIGLVRPFQLNGVRPDLLRLPCAYVANLAVYIVVPTLSRDRVRDGLAQFM